MASRDFDSDAPPPISTVRRSSSKVRSRGTASSGQTAESTSQQSLQTPSFRYSNTLTFIRGVLGRRDQEYVSDAPQSYPSAPSLRQGVSSSRFSGIAAPPVVAGSDNTGRTGNCWQRLNCCGRYPSMAPDYRKQYIWRLINSSTWNGILIGFTFALLFGPPLRELVIPKEGDIVVDCVFLVCFIFFLVDVVLRTDAESNYFHLYLGNAIGYSSGVIHDRIENGTDVTHIRCGQRSFPLHVGSFLFWCESISTLALLHEISFMDVFHVFDEATIEIEIDAFGMPTMLKGAFVNEVSPIEYGHIDLLIIIFRSMRVARYIRSSYAVKISSYFNSFVIYNMLEPIWKGFSFHIQNCWHFCRNGCRKSDPRRGLLPQEVIATRGGSGQLIRNQSWQDTVVTARLREKAHERNSKVGIGGMSVRLLRRAGIMKDNKREFRRQIAATKIQRAWRLHYSEMRLMEGSEYDANDNAWTERGAATNPMERVMKKRSMLQGSLSHSAAEIRSTGHTRAISERQNTRQRRIESQVGSAMRELTGQRVAIGIALALVMTVLLTYTEHSATQLSTMIVLHTQTENFKFADLSLQVARESSIPDLYYYALANGENRSFPLDGGLDPEKDLRSREKLRIAVLDTRGNVTTGYFSFKEETMEKAWVSLCCTFFVLCVWFFGVTSFAGPVMVLVVKPIERMVRLLEMLMRDPLGYQNTFRYRRFVSEEDQITRNTHWTKEVLKGMETSFLMSTILRIGSLMKVGFGSAGVEIIRNNLRKGQTKNTLILSSQGSTVSCIFLFSDIRQFTDATECLQEEVFVFTNRIAAVVHSICHSYGGAANKNIGDAFLLSWLLDEQIEGGAADTSFMMEDKPVDNFAAKSNQADKALLSVVKICMALHHDSYYVETMSEVARNALLTKLSKRKGPIVQMGFGLHAGTAVQGAIGSTRKIDATYVSEAVERAEYLESSTKKYGLKMLMSDSFHRLLHPNNRRRCRKIDQIIIRNEDDDEEEDGIPDGDLVELLTYDMDVDALWRDVVQGPMSSSTTRENDSDDIGSEKGRREGLRIPLAGRQGTSSRLKGARRRSLRLGKDLQGSEEFREGNFLAPGVNAQADLTETDVSGPPKFELPTGPALYNSNYWIKSPEIRKMRERYTDGLFFHDFNTGLQSFYAKDWDRAKQCFENILERFEDGPSRYFLNQIKEHSGSPPRNFQPYAIE